MKRSVLITVCAACAMFGATQVQAKPVFMKYDGVKGETQKAKGQKSGRVNVAAGDVNGDGMPKQAGKKHRDHKEWIPVQSAARTGQGGGGTGKASNHDIKASTDQAGLLVPAVQKVRN